MLELLNIALMLLLMAHDALCVPVCGRKKYLVGKECCPTCEPGFCVRTHCTQHATTRCAPCQPSTFTDAPNGQEKCTSCGDCKFSAKLRVKRACAPFSDTVCEPLEGHYCTDPIKDGCQGAVEHTKCKPGQYIKQPGTPSTDAVCEDCPAGTYSNGSLTPCRPHTQCEVMGLDVLKAGSSSQDTECWNSIVWIIVGITVLLVGGNAGGVIILCLRKKSPPSERSVSLQNALNEMNGSDRSPPQH